LPDTVVILGAGPAGLATAYFLCKRGLTSVLVLEKNQFVGGIAATFRHEDMLLDFGSHRVHPACDDETFGLLKSLLGDDLLTRPRRGAIWFYGRFIDFPLRIGQVASALGPVEACALVASYLRTQLSQRERFGSKQAEETSETILVRRFGRRLYRLFYEPYTTKVFGLSPDMMSPEQARRRVRSESLLDVAKAALNIKKTSSGRPPTVFYYPKLGFGQVCQKLAEAVEAEGGRIALGASPGHITIDKGRVRSVEYTWCEKRFSVSPDHLVSTIPLRQLTSLALPEKHPARTAAGLLRTRALVLLYLVVNNSSVGDRDAYYFPPSNIIFNRVSEQKNFSPYMIPDAKTCLCADISCDASDPVWTASDERLFELAKDSLRRTGIVQPERVSQSFVRRIRDAYPVYSLGYEKNFGRVEEWTDSVENLLTIGRQGLFAHNNFHHSILMARAAAEHILSGKPKRQSWSKAREGFASFKVID